MENNNLPPRPPVIPPKPPTQTSGNTSSQSANTQNGGTAFQPTNTSTSTSIHQTSPQPSSNTTNVSASNTQSTVSTTTPPLQRASQSQTSSPHSQVDIQKSIKSNVPTGKRKTLWGILFSPIFIIGLILGLIFFKKDTYERQTFVDSWLLSTIILLAIVDVAGLVLLLLKII